MVVVKVKESSLGSFILSKGIVSIIVLCNPNFMLLSKKMYDARFCHSSPSQGEMTAVAHVCIVLKIIILHTAIVFKDVNRVSGLRHEIPPILNRRNEKI